MAANLNEQAAQTERDRLIAQLEADRAKKAEALAAADAKLQAAQDGDFKARLGERRRSEMSRKEKVEVIAKLGEREYLNLDW